jgi:hypothetical protein
MKNEKGKRKKENKRKMKIKEIARKKLKKI